MKKEILEKRIEGLKNWLKKEKSEIFIEQKHCEEGTIERIYWHYGYMMALVDIVNKMEEK